MKVTIKNDFHGTSINLITDKNGYLNHQQVLKSRRALCGIKGCLCGGELGERGSQGGLEIISSGYGRDGIDVRIVDHSDEQ